MFRFAIPALGVVLVVTLAATAHAVVLCAKPRSNGTYNTSVKIREACKIGETEISASQLGLTSNAPLVRDSNGLVVGPLGSSINVGFNPAVMLKYAGGVAELGLKFDGSDFSDHLVLFYFSGSSCTGSIYLSHPTDQIIERGQLRGSTGYFLGADLGDTPVESRAIAGKWITPEGSLDPIDSQADCDALEQGFPATFIAPDLCCMAADVSLLRVAVPVSVDLSQFVPPFHIDFD